MDERKPRRCKDRRGAEADPLVLVGSFARLSLPEAV